jgi:hypothetical protein
LRRGPFKLEALSRKAMFQPDSQLKEIVMDTSKVIELGSVSEATQGILPVHVESFTNPATGPFQG